MEVEPYARFPSSIEALTSTARLCPYSRLPCQVVSLQSSLFVCAPPNLVLVPLCMPEPRSESPSLRRSTLLIPAFRTSIILSCHVILHFEQQRLSAITVIQAVSIRLPTRRLPYRFVSSRRYLCPPCPPPPPSSTTHL